MTKCFACVRGMATSRLLSQSSNCFFLPLPKENGPNEDKFQQKMCWFFLLVRNSCFGPLTNTFSAVFVLFFSILISFLKNKTFFFFNMEKNKTKIYHVGRQPMPPLGFEPETSNMKAVDSNHCTVVGVPCLKSEFEIYLFVFFSFLQSQQTLKAHISFINCPFFMKLVGDGSFWSLVLVVKFSI